MSVRRRSEESESIFGPNGAQDSFEDSDNGSPGRQTGARLSRRSGPGASQTRLSLNRTTGTAQTRGTATRARRTTPVAARRRRPVSDIVEDYDEDEDEVDLRNSTSSSARRQRGATSAAPRANNNTTMTATLDRNQGGGAVVSTYQRYPSDPTELAWYDRLMPDFVLNMTAPLTGYESRLDSDIDDDEYEILERQRLKRNRRIRRRLLTLVLLASAGALFMYSRGKLMRKGSVKAAVSTMKHRLEDGLAKSIQETMGK